MGFFILKWSNLGVLFGVLFGVPTFNENPDIISASTLFALHGGLGDPGTRRFHWRPDLRLGSPAACAMIAEAVGST